MYSRHLFIKTNQSCNLNCVYCYERNKNQNFFEVEQVLSKVLEILKEPTANGTKIKLIGGEPFLVFDQIRHFCERIWDEHLEETIHFQITTNGTLVHDEIQEWLKSHNKDIDCKLSLDGNKVSQDINRPHSFDFIDIPFFAETWDNCIVNMVITPQTLPFYADNVIFLHECGFKNIVPLFAVLTNWEEKNLQKTYYEQLILLAEYYTRNPKVHRCKTLNLHLDRILTKCDCVLCDIGKKIIYDIDSNKYYPCHLFFPSVCGENRPQNMDLLDFSSRSQIEHSPCKTCRFINLCHTCYAANYIERGDMGKRDMSICDYRKIDFLINAKLEYHRIITSRNISNTDYLIMKAISEVQNELEKIEQNYIVQ